MNRKSLESCLAALPARLRLPAAELRGLLDAACLPARAPGVARSWFESSLASGREPSRFIHYYRLRPGLAGAARARLWTLAYRRFELLLERMNAGGAGFALARAQALGAALFAALERHAAVIVSAEWGAAGWGKATVYAVTERPFGPDAAAALAAAAGGGGAWLAAASAEHMAFLGADFYPGGRVGLKVYRRYLPAEARLEPAARRAAARLGGTAACRSVHEVFKAGPRGVPRLDKTHFTIKGRLPDKALAASAGRAAAAHFSRRAAPFGRLTFVGVKPGKPGAELYFG